MTIGAMHGYRWKAEQEMLRQRERIAELEGALGARGVAAAAVVKAADALCQNMTVEEYGQRLVLLHQAVDAWREKKSDYRQPESSRT